jgi:hypothetical protein
MGDAGGDEIAVSPASRSASALLIGILHAPALCVVAVTVACAKTSDQSETPPTPTSSEPDSLVLERTACYGTCPAYRIRLSNRGEILFRATYDSTQTFRDTVAATTLSALAARAREIGFFELPPEIAKDSILCHNMATDHPTATTTLFASSHSKGVVDYHGCFETVEHEILPRVQRLRDFEDEIDSVLRSSRWVKPTVRR